MTPVTQTRTGWGIGNCTEATIASLLDVDLAAVPDLYDATKGPTLDRDARWVVLHDWLRARGRIYVQVTFPRLSPPPDDLSFLPEGLRERFVEAEYHGIGGHNPDGVGHAVVGRLGRILWDPNPLRRGLVDIDEVFLLAPLELVAEEFRSWPGLGYRVEDGVLA